QSGDRQLPEGHQAGEGEPDGEQRGAHRPADEGPADAPLGDLGAARLPRLWGAAHCALASDGFCWAAAVEGRGSTRAPTRGWFCPAVTTSSPPGHPLRPPATGPSPTPTWIGRRATVLSAFTT